MEKIQLPEDPILLEMLPDYLISWERDFSTRFEEIIATKDVFELKRFGHTLKGSSRQFSMRHIAEYGTTIQQYAESEDFQSALKLKEVVLQELSSVKQYLISAGLMGDSATSEHQSNL
jgi:HPt (histidine-containing phosphotransfer) domain-containing protein